MDWIEVALGRDRWRALVNAVMNLRVTLNAENFLTTFELVSFSRRTLLHGVSIKEKTVLPLQFGNIPSRTNNYVHIRYLLGLLDSPLCRKCGVREETSAHILCAKLWPH